MCCADVGRPLRGFYPRVVLKRMIALRGTFVAARGKFASVLGSRPKFAKYHIGRKSLLIICVLAAAGGPSCASAGTTFVDNSAQNDDGDGYYIVLFARPIGDYAGRSKNLLTGYTFVGFGVESNVKGLDWFKAFGLYPDQVHPGQRVLLGEVPEEITEEEAPAIQQVMQRTSKEISGYIAYKRANGLVVKVDKTDWDNAYDAAKTGIDRLRRVASPPLSYPALVLDYVDWMADRAVGLGLKVPRTERTLSTAWLPLLFVKKVVSANIGYADHVKEADGTTWTGPTFEGEPSGAGTMTWPDASFVGLAKRGHRVTGITKFDGGDSFDGVYDNAGRGLSGIYRWRGGAQFDGLYVQGREADGTYTTADGWRLTGKFSQGRWQDGVITSPDHSLIFTGSVNASGGLAGTRNERGTNGRRSLNFRNDGSTDGNIIFDNGDVFTGSFRPDTLLPLTGEYHFASNGATRTGAFGPDSQLRDGVMEEPFVMFPLTVIGGKVDGTDRPTPPCQAFIPTTTLPVSPPTPLPGHEAMAPSGPTDRSPNG